MINLNFKLYDSSKQKYNINMDFTTCLIITATNEMTFPKKQYTCSLQLNILQNIKNFHYNTIQDYYTPFNEFLKSNSYEIFTYPNYVILKIKKQYYMQNDVTFSLTEKAMDITNTINEICKKITELENKSENKGNFCSRSFFITKRLDKDYETKYYELEKKYNNILNELNYIKASLFLDEDKRTIDNFFDY